jgi:hypothetical protein
MRFRYIAGALAAVMAAALGVPAAASAATGSVPRMSYGPNPGHEAPPAGPAAGGRLDSLAALPDETVARRAGQGLRVRRERHSRPRP